MEKRKRHYMLTILPFRLAQWCIPSLMRCSNTQGHMYHVYSNYTEALLSPALPRCYNAVRFQELFSKGYRKAKKTSVTSRFEEEGTKMA